jgi:hypothetical protein
MSGPWINDGMPAAIQLREYLQCGGDPAAQQPTMRLYQNEAQYFASNFRLFAYEGRDVQYSHIRGSFSPGGLAVSAASAPLNMLFKANAKRRGRPQWRETARGVVHATNQRLVLKVDHSLVEWYHDALATVELASLGVYVAHHGADASVLDVGSQANPWFYVLLSYLGLGNRNPPLPA